jgi:hypothetical protein
MIDRRLPDSRTPAGESGVAGCDGPAGPRKPMGANLSERGHAERPTPDNGIRPPAEQPGVSVDITADKPDAAYKTQSLS